MENTKNSIYAFVFLILVGILIFFIPNIYDFVKNHNKAKIQETTNVKINNQIPTKYTCTVVTYSETSLNDSVTKNVVFEISNEGKINKFTLTKTSAFSSKKNYDK